MAESEEEPKEVNPEPKEVKKQIEEKEEQNPIYPPEEKPS